MPTAPWSSALRVYPSILDSGTSPVLVNAIVMVASALYPTSCEAGVRVSSASASDGASPATLTSTSACELTSPTTANRLVPVASKNWVNGPEKSDPHAAVHCQAIAPPSPGDNESNSRAHDGTRDSTTTSSTTAGLLLVATTSNTTSSPGCTSAAAGLTCSSSGGPPSTNNGTDTEGATGPSRFRSSSVTDESAVTGPAEHSNWALSPGASGWNPGMNRSWQENSTPTTVSSRPA